MTKSNIYLDYASGVKANPSSIHSLGIKAKSDLEEARQNTALVLNAKSSEIIFSGKLYEASSGYFPADFSS